MKRETRVSKTTETECNLVSYCVHRTIKLFLNYSPILDGMGTFRHLQIERVAFSNLSVVMVITARIIKGKQLPAVRGS